LTSVSSGRPSRGAVPGRIARAALAAAVAVSCALATGTPAYADQTRDAQWYADTWKYDQLHAVSQGEGVTVAVVDTGVQAGHPDLTGSVLPGLDAWSPAKDGRQDSIGHGTAMASLIAGHGHGTDGRDGILGVAPKAKILPVGAYPPGAKDFTPNDLGTGIRWATDHGAQVICLALGGGSDPQIESGVKYALARGVILVAAVGNKPRAHSVNFPAAYQGVVAVSATDKSGTFAKDVSVSGFEVLLSAPGTNVISAALDNRYDTESGTSSSAALVAGVAALIKARYPELNGQQIYQRMKATAVDKGAAGHDEEYGYGVVDPLAALTKDVPVASASAGAPVTATPPADLGEETGTGKKILLSVLVIAGWLVVVGLIVGLVVYLVRRRRRR